MIKIIETSDKRYACYEKIPSDFEGCDEVNYLLELLRTFGYTLILQSYKNKEMPLKVYAYIDKEPNAFAVKQGAMYYVGISTGTFSELKSWFNTWLACPKTYEILNITKTENLSMTLCYFSLLFLIAHECVHILYGHCDYFQNTGGFFFERSNDDTTKDMLYEQALELCADCCAILMCMIQSVDREKEERAIKEQVRRVLFAVYSIFRLFSEDENYDFEEFIGNDLYKYDHPHSGIRFSVVINMSKYSLEFLRDLNIESIINEYMSFEKEVLGIEDVKRMITSIAYTAKGAEHIKKLLLKWNEIRHLYLPYAKLELLKWKEVGEPPVFINDNGNVIQNSSEVFGNTELIGSVEQKLMELYGDYKV